MAAGQAPHYVSHMYIYIRTGLVWFPEGDGCLPRSSVFGGPVMIRGLEQGQPVDPLGQAGGGGYLKKEREAED